MKKQIAILKGDGIGPEIVAQAVIVLETIANRYDHVFELVEVEIGARAIDKYGVAITDEALRECESSDAILLGAIGDPRFDNDPTLKVRPEQGLLKLRKELGLFANIRPIQTYPEIIEFSPLKETYIDGVDFVIYRELIGGSYFGKKTTAEDGSYATDLCSYTVEQIEQITHKAFQGAMQRRKHVTLVDKANVMETSRLWRKEVARIAQQYPEVTLDFLFVDNAAMQIIQNPKSFDVILTENMFGDILSDLASVITGSIGMLPSASLGHKNGLFEPIHGSYPQAKNLDIANPNATILSVAMMLDYFGLTEEAEVVRGAVKWSLEKGFVTRDLNSESPLACSMVGFLISEYIEEGGSFDINEKNTDAAKGIFI